VVMFYLGLLLWSLLRPYPPQRRKRVGAVGRSRAAVPAAQESWGNGSDPAAAPSYEEWTVCR
jgi:hypothetical protein